jgi:hypothetical protein
MLKELVVWIHKQFSSHAVAVDQILEVLSLSPPVFGTIVPKTSNRVYERSSEFESFRGNFESPEST